MDANQVGKIACDGALACGMVVWGWLGWSLNHIDGVVHVVGIVGGGVLLWYRIRAAYFDVKIKRRHLRK